MVQKRKRNKKWLSLIIALMLLVGAGVVCFLVWNAYFKDKDNHNDKVDASVVEEQKKEEKKTEKKTEEKKEETVEKEKTVQYDGDDPNTKGELTGVITYAGVNNGKLMIRVNIDQYVSGTCTLSLRREGMNVGSQEAPIISSASTATCEGFDVSTDSLGSGKTSIIIYLSGDGKTGEISGEVDL